MLVLSLELEVIIQRGRKADYVLSSFTDDEEAAIKPLVDKCVEGVLSIVMEGLERTMTKFNS